MSKISFSEDELNSLSKDVLVKFFLQLQDNFQELSRQNDANTKELLKQISNLQEQLAILTNYRFGRKTEKTSEMLDGQRTWLDGCSSKTTDNQSMDDKTY